MVQLLLSGDQCDGELDHGSAIVTVTVVVQTFNLCRCVVIDTVMTVTLS